MSRKTGATENARPENAGLENDGQLRKELQGLEMQDRKMTNNILANSEQNYGGWKMLDRKMTDNILANSEQNYGGWKMQDWKMTDKILTNWPKLRGLENAGLDNDGQC